MLFANGQRADEQTKQNGTNEQTMDRKTKYEVKICGKMDFKHYYTYVRQRITVERRVRGKVLSSSETTLDRRRIRQFPLKEKIPAR